MAEPDSAPSSSGNVAEKFPPAGGMGDWGFPQQAHLSYKRYACAGESKPGMGVFHFIPTDNSSEIVISLDGIKADDQLLSFQLAHIQNPVAAAANVLQDTSIAERTKRPQQMPLTGFQHISAKSGVVAEVTIFLLPQNKLS